MVQLWRIIRQDGASVLDLEGAVVLFESETAARDWLMAGERAEMVEVPEEAAKLYRKAPPPRSDVD